MQIDYTDEFKRNLTKLARRYRRIRVDVEPVIERLSNGETLGDRISGVGFSAYKVRVRNSDAARGKSGGYRLLYYLRTADRLALVTIYSKTDKDDIPVDELSRLIKEYLNDASE